jgi:hypothetical protein
LRRIKELSQDRISSGEVLSKEDHRQARDGVHPFSLYVSLYEESTDHIENILILPTRAHVAVAYQPYNSQIQTIKIYSFKTE